MDYFLFLQPVLEFSVVNLNKNLLSATESLLRKVVKILYCNVFGDIEKDRK